MIDGSFLQDMCVLLAIGIPTAVFFHRFNLPPVLGFLLTGLLCGPYGFGFVDNIAGVEHLAELGVVLLLFTIGIEFSFERLKQLRRFLIFGGTLQVLVTIGSAALIAVALGTTWSVAVFIGMLISLSSTVLVVRMLQHRGEMASGHGTAAVGILVYQDLCIVPMVLLTPFLGNHGGNLMSVAILTGKSLGFVVAAVAVARFVVPWMLNHVALTRQRETFVLAIMLLCLGMGWATSLVGLSLALGAFLAGIVISESKFSHQALGDVLPFREMFNFLVFVSIGMLFDPRTLLVSPLAIAGGVLALVVLKSVVLAAIIFAFGYSARVAIISGLALSQVSEFSFVLAKVGMAQNVWDHQLNQLFLAVAIISMAITPLLVNLGFTLAGVAEKVLPEKWVSGRRSFPKPPGDGEQHNHAIIVGYDLPGRAVAKALAAAHVPFVIVDANPATVRAERKNGLPISYGDASTQNVLEHAGINEARLLVLTTADVQTAVRSSALALRLNPAIRLVARMRCLDDVRQLHRIGVTDVVADEVVGADALAAMAVARSAESAGSDQKET